MNVQRFVMAVVAVFVTFGAVFAGLAPLVFADQFAAISAAIGLNEEPKLVIWAGRILITVVFCYIFLQGREGKGIVEGVRYGLLIGLLMVGVDLDWFAYTDIGLSDGIAAWITTIVGYVAAGAVMAAVYKPNDEAEA